MPDVVWICVLHRDDMCLYMAGTSVITKGYLETMKCPESGYRGFPSCCEHLEWTSSTNIPSAISLSFCHRAPEQHFLNSHELGKPSCLQTTLAFAVSQKLPLAALPQTLLSQTSTRPVVVLTPWSLTAPCEHTPGSVCKEL